MKKLFPEEQISAAKTILATLAEGEVELGILKLRALKDELYDSIPAKQRQSRGITWVLQQIAYLFTTVCDGHLETIKAAGLVLYKHLGEDDIMQGVAIFLMSEYGKHQPKEVYAFFERTAGSQNWVVREFAAAGFHKIIAAQRERVLPFLEQCARSSDPNLRRFVSESLRPVTDLRWINQRPEFSLGVLRLLFTEAHPYPRTSVGNNLSDLSRRQPELVFSLVEGLVGLGDKNSLWIAQRACRNLVKKHPARVMDSLGLDEYHYKDRHYYRGEIE